MPKRISLFLLSLLLCNYLSSQQLDRMAAPFFIDGQPLANPLAGGLNGPQFSSADLNNDGQPDLYVFDRLGGVHLPFLHSGEPNTTEYTYAPELAANFPEVDEWVLLRDYNGDGVMDLFGFSDAPAFGIMAYRGYWDDNDRLAFERVTFDKPFNLLYFPLTSGGETPIYISNIDYPALDDLDCDGDLDILTFASNGGFLEFYANQSVEMGYERDSLIFVLEDDCWGGIYESGLSEVIDLAAAPSECAQGFTDPPDQRGPRHVGSTVLTFDANNDGPRELVLGDISFTNLSFLSNGGSCSQPWLNDQDNYFPAYDFSVDIPVFPAAFYLDLNNDGKRDFLASPNEPDNGASYAVAWYYQNVNTDEIPVFEFVQDDFLVEQMVDLGHGAQPAVADVNGDGLPDIVAGNYSGFVPGGASDPRLFLFLNVGSANAPAFEQVDDDWLGMNQFSTTSFAFAPAFGDLDADGDLDILVGENYGKLFFAENTAGPGNPMAFGPWQYAWQDIDVGLASTPAIVDIDRDGLPDLAIGERNGNVNFFKNTGSASAPAFNGDPEAAPNNFFLGSVDARVSGSSIGYSVPAFFEQAGEWRMILGTRFGRLELYGDIESNIYDSFTLLNEYIDGVRVGERSYPAPGDLNQDGYLDLVVGNARGGFSIYTTDLVIDPALPTVEPKAAARFAIFPNPATDQVRVQIDPSGAGSTRVLELFDAAGRRLQRREWRGENITFPVAGLPRGLYFVRLKSGGAAATKKLILN